MARKRVTVKGGGENLYYISESSGTFYVYKCKVGMLMNDETQIGKTRNMDDALSLIKSQSGRAIDSIG